MDKATAPAFWNFRMCLMREDEDTLRVSTPRDIETVPRSLEERVLYLASTQQVSAPEQALFRTWAI